MLLGKFKPRPGGSYVDEANDETRGRETCLFAFITFIPDPIMIIYLYFIFINSFCRNDES